MKTAGIVIAAWLAVDFAILVVFGAFGAWRTRQTRERARRFLTEDRLRDSLEAAWHMPSFDPREHA